MTTPGTLNLMTSILVAALLGGAIGLEREYRAKDAGFRTHFLVALGSALFMVLSRHGFDDIIGVDPRATFDPSRLAAQVVSGIGFIGAGTIIFQKHVLRGLTTAAGLWVTSAIGLTCGSGMYGLAMASTLIVVLCLETLYYIHSKLGTRRIALNFTSNSREHIRQVIERMRSEGLVFDNYSMTKETTTDSHRYQVSMELKTKRDKYQERIMDLLEKMDGVSVESIE